MLKWCAAHDFSGVASAWLRFPSVVGRGAGRLGRDVGGVNAYQLSLGFSEPRRLNQPGGGCGGGPGPYAALVRVSATVLGADHPTLTARANLAYWTRRADLAARWPRSKHIATDS